MKLSAELAGKEYPLSITVEGQHVTAEIEGRNYRLDVRELGGNQYLMFADPELFECRVEPSCDNITVHLRQRSFNITIIDPKRLRSSQSGGRHDPDSVEIIAPMPGKVVRVLVSEGAKVAAGAGILVVEAMKMQNELKTPKSGTVRAIRAEPGATVNAGEVLAVVE